ncbi:type III pantothenate kinase [Alicyclobacillus mengziensis]
MFTVLAMDIGNSNTTMGLFGDRNLLGHWRISTNLEQTADELGFLVTGLIKNAKMDNVRVDGISISSVVPSVMYAVEEMAQTYLGQSPLVVGPGIRTGLVIKYDNPKEAGSDRIANAVAAIESYGAPVIIVDFGTATTFTVVDEHRQYLGGVIAPGVKISAEALFRRASKLPHIDLVRPASVIGRNTVSSMQSGLVYGFAGQVDGIVRRIIAEVGSPYRVVATGGLARVVSPHSETIVDVDPFLTLKGLQLIWERNRGRHEYNKM